MDLDPVIVGDMARRSGLVPLDEGGWHDPATKVVIRGGPESVVSYLSAKQSGRLNAPPPPDAPDFLPLPPEGQRFTPPAPAPAPTPAPIAAPGDSSGPLGVLNKMAAGAAMPTPPRRAMGLPGPSGPLQSPNPLPMPPDVTTAMPGQPAGMPGATPGVDPDQVELDAAAKASKLRAMLAGSGAGLSSAAGLISGAPVQNAAAAEALRNPTAPIQAMLERRKAQEALDAAAEEKQHKANLPGLLSHLSAFRGLPPEALARLTAKDVPYLQKDYDEQTTRAENERKSKHDAEQEKYLHDKEGTDSSERARHNKAQEGVEWYKAMHPADHAAGKESAQQQLHMQAIQDAQAAVKDYQHAVESGADDQTLKFHHDNLVGKLREAQKKAPTRGAALGAMLNQIPDSGRLMGKGKELLGLQDPRKALGLLKSSLDQEAAIASHGSAGASGPPSGAVRVRDSKTGLTKTLSADRAAYFLAKEPGRFSKVEGQT